MGFCIKARLQRLLLTSLILIGIQYSYPAYARNKEGITMLQESNRIGRIAMLFALADAGGTLASSASEWMEALPGQSGVYEFQKNCCFHGNRR